MVTAQTDAMLTTCRQRVHSYAAACDRATAIEANSDRAARLHQVGQDARRFLRVYDDVSAGVLTMTPLEIRRLADQLDWGVFAFRTTDAR